MSAGRIRYSTSVTREESAAPSFPEADLWLASADVVWIAPLTPRVARSPYVQRSEAELKLRLSF